ncbi:MAG TPA: hypothetical protein VGR61_04675 [Candidatus Dormibacteraeota bacterium]|nr:hypothetical protein [Candidatus Dormibacteraeota bacterium]
MSQRVDVAEAGDPGRRPTADAIFQATQHLAAILHRIEAGELEMSPRTVRQLEEATQVLEDLVEEAG